MAKNSKSAESSDSEFQVKMEELVQLAKEQGYITYEEINEILPMTFDSARADRPGTDLLERAWISRSQPG